MREGDRLFTSKAQVPLESGYSQAKTEQDQELQQQTWPRSPDWGYVGDNAERLLSTGSLESKQLRHQHHIQ